MKVLLHTFFVLFFLSSVTLMAEENSAQENSTEKKVVYDLKTGDIKKLELYLISAVIRNSSYYEGRFEELNVRVVIHGKAYGFFQKNSTDPKMIEIGKKLRSLYESYNVTFEICEVGMKKRKIAKETLYLFVKVVPNATIALIDAQNDGYAYLPLH